MPDFSKIAEALSQAYGKAGSALPESYADPNIGPGAFLANAAKGVGNIMMLPGDVYQGNVSMWDENGRTNPEVIGRAADLAGMVTLGAGAAPAGANELRAGFSGRKLPRDNYNGPVNRYTDELFREMSPTEAIIDLPTSVAHGGYGLNGNRRFYADQPDLALGQGGNRGVRVTYDAAPFEGKINQKPGWETMFPSGSAEYVAAPTPSANIRDYVKGFEIDPSALSRVEAAQYDRVLKNLEGLGWGVIRAPDKITAQRAIAEAMGGKAK